MRDVGPGGDEAAVARDRERRAVQPNAHLAHGLQAVEIDLVHPAHVVAHIGPARVARVVVHQVRGPAGTDLADRLVRAAVDEDDACGVTGRMAAAHHHRHQVGDIGDRVGGARRQLRLVGDEHGERGADVVDRPSRVRFRLCRDQPGDAVAVAARQRAVVGRVRRHQRRRAAGDDACADLRRGQPGRVAVERRRDVAAAVDAVAHRAVIGEQPLGPRDVVGSAGRWRQQGGDAAGERQHGTRERSDAVMTLTRQAAALSARARPCAERDAGKGDRHGRTLETCGGRRPTRTVSRC